jgi:hypothetical protein
MSHESHERRAVSGVKVARTTRTEHDFKQTRRGRPGPDTAYRRITHRRYDLEWNIDSAAVTYDEKSDGTYPLITNDRKLTPLEVLDTHKGQQTLEKRFEQLKTVHAIAPVFLKNPARIEAFFTIYFFASFRPSSSASYAARCSARLKELPLYPEQRLCKQPTTEQMLRLFSLAERHVLTRSGRTLQLFETDLTPLQRQVLDLLGVPGSASRPYRRRKFTRNHALDVRKVRPAPAGSALATCHAGRLFARGPPGRREGRA